MVVAKKLFIPGPVDVSDDVAAKMSEPMVGHRSKAYASLHGETVANLKRLLFTEGNVFLGTCSSTGWMEAAVLNCVEAKSLHVVNGAFSSRWAKIAAAWGRQAEVLEVPWGSAGKPEQVEEKLAEGGFDALFVTHNETSTAAMTPLEGFSEVAKKHGALFCVDAVSSVAGVKVEVDKLGIDVLVTGTQKALAVAPGLAVTAVSEAAMKKSEAMERKGYYFDYVEYAKRNEKNNTPTTPAIPQIRALNFQLGKILDEEGLDARCARHAELAEYTRAWMKKHWEPYTEEWCASNTVSCAKNSRGADLADLKGKLSEKGYAFSNGYGKLKGGAFRVAHMGDRKIEDLKEYLSVIDEILGLE